MKIVVVLFLLCYSLLAIPTPEIKSFKGIVPAIGDSSLGCTAYIVNKNGDKTIDKPVIIVEGFDLLGMIDYKYMYNLSNKASLLDHLVYLGYDIIFIDFDNGRDWIENNAKVVENVVLWAKSEASPSSNYEKTVIVGPSMGGVVSRLALLNLEAKNIDHGCRTLICFDSPHRGANIAIANQLIIQYLSTLTPSAQPYVESFDTPAAQQLLSYYAKVDRAALGGDVLIGEDIIQKDKETNGGCNLYPKNGFLKHLSYPKKCRLVALSNGSLSGKKNFMTSKDLNGNSMMYGEVDNSFFDKFSISKIEVDAWSVGKYKEDEDQIIGAIRLLDLGLISMSGATFKRNFTERNWMYEVDNSPGSYTDINQIICDNIDKVATFPAHCFIPVLSSIDVPVNRVSSLTDNLLVTVGYDSLLSLSPFDTIYAPYNNQEHLEMTEENRNWFIDEIAHVVYNEGLSLDENDTINSVKKYLSSKSIVAGDISKQDNVLSVMSSYDYVEGFGIGKRGVVDFKAEDEIVLKAGFFAEDGAEFTGKIIDEDEINCETKKEKK